MCFTFLYQQENKVQAPLVPYGINLEYLFVPQQNSSTGKSGKYTVIEPNCNNETSRNQICKYFDEDGCKRWCSCCMSASACCERQLRMPLRQEVKSDYNQCPRTWDGYSCWDDSPPATTVHNRCPPFISSRFVDYSSKLPLGYSFGASLKVNLLSYQEVNKFTASIDLKIIHSEPSLCVFRNVSDDMVFFIEVK